MRMGHFKRAASIILISCVALSAHADNDNNNGNNGNNGNHNGQIRKEEKQTVAIPEPAAFALLGAGLAALGVRAVLRRRKGS